MRLHPLATSLLGSALLFSPLAKASTTPYNWTGVYVGFNVGAVNHTMNITDNQAVTFNATLQQVSNPQLTGGLQIGYRRQSDKTLTSGVYGLEFSANFANTKSGKEYGSPFALYQLRSVNNLKNVHLIEFIGGIAANQTLLFLAAGLAWINISGSIINQDGLPFFTTINTSDKTIAPVIGCGLEYGFTEKVSTRLKVDLILPNAYTTYDNAGNSYQIANNLVQASLAFNYKFG